MYRIWNVYTLFELRACNFIYSLMHSNWPFRNVQINERKNKQSLSRVHFTSIVYWPQTAKTKRIPIFTNSERGHTIWTQIVCQFYVQTKSALIVNHFDLCLPLMRSNGKSEYNCDCLHTLSSDFFTPKQIWNDVCCTIKVGNEGYNEREEKKINYSHINSYTHTSSGCRQIETTNQRE